MTYIMTKTTARRWFKRLGRQFKEECLNLEIPGKQIVETYGVANNLVTRIRQAMCKDYKPRALDYSDPKIYDVLTGDMTQQEAARILGISQTTVGRYRRILGFKPRVPRELRYDDETMLLLRSQLPDEAVALSLGVEPSTIRKHRLMMKPQRRPSLSSEEVERLTPKILAARTAAEAARELGIGRSTAQAIRARHKTRRPPPAQFGDAAWCKDRTIAEIAAAVGMSDALVRYYVRTRGIIVKPSKTGISYAQRQARRANRADNQRPQS